MGNHLFVIMIRAMYLPYVPWFIYRHYVCTTLAHLSNAVQYVTLQKSLSLIDRYHRQLRQLATVDLVSRMVDRFTACMNDVDNWLKASRLRRNASKTQVMIWLGSSQQLQRLNIGYHTSTFCLLALMSLTLPVTRE